MVSFNPLDVLAGWGRALNTPIGYILLALVVIYILLRINGVIENSPFERILNRGKGGGGRAGGSIKQRPDYVIK